MKDYLVVFTKTNARILVNPPNMAELLMNNQAVLNPSMEYVKSTPPHFWKYDGGFIVPMNPEEMKQRLELIKQVGVDNSIINVNQSNVEPSPNFHEIISKKDQEILKLHGSLNVVKEEHKKLSDAHERILKSEATYREQCFTNAKNIKEWHEQFDAEVDKLESKINYYRNICVYLSMSSLGVITLILVGFLWRK